MKSIFTLFLLLLTVNSFAQLTIKPTTGTSNNKDNYVYVTGTVLYVKKDVKLTANSNSGLANIYLRKKAQLVQSDDIKNSGNGTLSVFQEGTVDQYDYNYWGSPVGIKDLETTPATGNLSFGITGLFRPIDKKSSEQTETIEGYDGQANPLKIATVWINTFMNTNSTDYADWNQVGASTEIGPGYGFTMKGVSGSDNTTVNGVKNNQDSAQRYDFRGRPHNGDITLPIPADANGSGILVGNPYPSAMNLNYFLIKNSSSGTINTEGDVFSNACGNEQRRNATTGIAYFWSSDPDVFSHYLTDYKGGYGTYSPAGSCNSTGVYAPPTYFKYDEDGVAIGSGSDGSGGTDQRAYCPIGQGFFVNAPESGTINPIKFRNAYRVGKLEGEDNHSVFQRSANTNDDGDDEITDTSGLTPVPKLRLNIAFDDLYTRQAALAFSPFATTGVDVAMDAKNYDDLGSDAGFLIDNTNYVIDIRPFDEDDVIPLALQLDQDRDLAFNINNFEDFDTENVYIYDASTDEYHPIKDNYFYISLPDGNYDGRFKLTFRDNTKALSTANATAKSFSVFQNNRAAQLEVINPELANLKSVQVFDMTGKLLINKQNLSTKERYVFSTARFAEAIYVVSITTKENIKTTRKITVMQP